MEHLPIFALMVETPRPLPRAAHVAFAFNDQQVDVGDGIKMHVERGWWLVYDLDGDPVPTLMSYMDFLDYYQPVDASGYEYLEEVFNAMFPDDPEAPVAPVDDEIDPMFPEQDVEDEVFDEEFNPCDFEVKKRVQCSCGTHELSLYASGDTDGELEIAAWSLGRGTQKWGWKHRLKMIWQIVTQGHCHSDWVVLSAEEQKSLRDALNDVEERMNAYRTCRDHWRDVEQARQREIDAQIPSEEILDLMAQHAIEEQRLYAIIADLTEKLRKES